jgi:hypothetical protein
MWFVYPSSISKHTLWKTLHGNYINLWRASALSPITIFQSLQFIKMFCLPTLNTIIPISIIYWHIGWNNRYINVWYHQDGTRRWFMQLREAANLILLNINTHTDTHTHTHTHKNNIQHVYGRSKVMHITSVVLMSVACLSKNNKQGGKN